MKIYGSVSYSMHEHHIEHYIKKMKGDFLLCITQIINAQNDLDENIRTLTCCFLFRIFKIQNCIVLNF